MGGSKGSPTGNFNGNAQHAIERVDEYNRQHGGKLASAITSAQKIVRGDDTARIETCDMLELGKVMQKLGKSDPSLKAHMEALNKTLTNKFDGDPMQCKP